MYNLACSGATTATHGTASGEDFKPGIDFYSDAAVSVSGSPRT